jgi:hypothetical protein
MSCTAHTCLLAYFLRCVCFTRVLCLCLFAARPTVRITSEPFLWQVEIAYSVLHQPTQPLALQPSAVRVPGVTTSPYSLNGLPRDARLALSLRASNSFGWGEQSAPIEVSTAACATPAELVMDGSSAEHTHSGALRGGADAALMKDEERSLTTLTGALVVLALVCACTRAACCWAQGGSSKGRRRQRPPRWMSGGIKMQRVHLSEEEAWEAAAADDDDEEEEEGVESSRPPEAADAALPMTDGQNDAISVSRCTNAAGDGEGDGEQPYRRAPRPIVVTADVHEVPPTCLRYAPTVLD